MNAELLAGNIVAHWLQAGILAASALLAMRLLVLDEPRARLAALHLTLAGILLLPLMQPWTPAEPAIRAAPAVTTMEAAPVTSEALAPMAAEATASIDPAFAAVTLAALGIVIRLLWLVYGVASLTRFSRTAAVIPTPDAARSLEADLGVSPRYIQQSGTRGPWTFGFVRPTIALPSGFDALAPSFQRSVVCHELIHIKRRDMAVAFGEELAVAALWCHPWIWLLRARIRVAREQVVDRRVVALLGNRDEYVRCLVDMSGHDLAPHFSQASAGMLRPRELRARVDAIFQEVHMSRARFAAAAFAFLAVVIATGLAAFAAMPMRSAPAADRAASIVLESPRQSPGVTSRVRLEPATGSPINLQFTKTRLRDVLAFIGHATSIVFTGYEESFDEGGDVTIEATIDESSPVERLLDRLLTPKGLTYTVQGPRTVAIARNPLAQSAPAPRVQINTVYAEYPSDALERGIRGTVIVDITVNAAGDVTTAAVESGPQALRASALKAALSLRYAKGQSTTAMKVAFEYTLTAASWGVRINGAAPNIGQRPPAIGSRGTLEQGDANPDASGAYRISDTMQPPRKLKDAAPVYPPLAQEGRVQGVVIMEARIDESGLVSDVKLLRSIPLLDDAAIEAVRQWQYTPTLLNGVAVPVRLTVTINFSLRPIFYIQLALSDGSTTVLDVLAGAMVPAPEGRVQLRARRSRESEPLTVSLFTDDGQTHLGDVALELKGPAVQSPTSPSFSLRFLGVQ